MGLFTTKSNSKEQLIALFAIGSGSVGGALIRFTLGPDGNWAPHIIAQDRTFVPFQTEFHFETFFANMQVALRGTADKIFHKKQGAPDSIFCTMTSPWCVSETRKINFSKDEAFSINSKLMTDMINAELSNILDFYGDKYKGMDSEPYLMESKVIHTKLNGYDIENPIGMKAKSIKINLFASICPSVSISDITETLNDIFHNREINFGSFLFSMLIVAREKLPQESSYFMIDINAELTDVGIVNNGILVATISFPMGKNYIIRSIVKELNKTESEARSLFAMMISGTISEGEKLKLDPILASIKTEWTKLLKNSLDSLPQTISTSSNVFLVADLDSATWFASFLSDKSYTQQALNQKYFNIVTMNGQKLLDVCKVSDGTCDQFLMMEAIALARMLPK